MEEKENQFIALMQYMLPIPCNYAYSTPTMETLRETEAGKGYRHICGNGMARTVLHDKNSFTFSH